MEFSRSPAVSYTEETGGGGGIEEDVNRRLNSGNCRQKLNDVLKALGKEKIKDKKSGKTGFDGLMAQFFDGRVDPRVGGHPRKGTSAYSSDTGKITLDTTPSRGDPNSAPDVRLTEALSSDMLHEGLHGATRSGFSHKEIFKAIAKVDNLKFIDFTNDRLAALANIGKTPQNTDKSSYDSSMYSNIMDTWLNKTCGGNSTEWDTRFKQYERP